MSRDREGHPGHYIKEWRLSKQRMSLRRLADRMLNPDGSRVISHASLSRIEKGEQPYTQPVLKALAEALGTDEGSLIMRDPSQEQALYSIWDQIPASKRGAAMDMLEGLKKSKG